MRRWTVRSKLAVLVATALVGLTLLATMALTTIQRVEVGSDAYDRIVAQKDLVADVLPPPLYLVETLLTAHQLASATEPAERDDLTARLAALRAQYDDRYEHWDQNLEQEETREALLERSHASALAMFEILDAELAPAASSGDLAAATEIVNGSLSEAYEQHRQAIDDVVEPAVAQQQAEEASTTALRETRLQMLIAVIVFVVVALVVIAAAIARSIARPLRELSEAARRLARGDLAVSIEHESNDDLGLLADAVRHTGRDLSGTVTSIRAQADRLRRSAGALVTVSGSLAGQADQTVARSGDAAAEGDRAGAAMQAVSSAIDEISANVESLAQQALGTADRSKLARATAEQIASNVGDLEAASHDIVEVVGLITAISEQTNLLALNATIEAARVGEAGRGFLVVANEVKALANQTGEATERIAARVDTMQREVARARSGIVDVTGIVGEIESAQARVAMAVTEQVESLHEMRSQAEGARTHATGVRDRLVDVHAIAEDAGSEAASAARSAAELLALAGELDDLVGTFRT